MKYFFETLRLKNELLWNYGLLCLIGSILCLILVKIVPTPIQGVSGWMKPFKFFLTTTIISWTMGFYMIFLENQGQVRVYSWSLVILLSVEVILITYQASKGTLSHFNQENEAGKIIFSIMAIAITLFMIHTAYIAWLFQQQKHFEIQGYLVLSIKLALVITVIFAFEGYIMGALMRHTVGAEDGTPGLAVLNWSKTHGDLRVAHFFGIHALQMIPLISYILASNKKDVFFIALVYFLFVTFILIQALRGKPFM
jgi:hypothetical protein